MIHELKIEPKYFDAISKGEKRWEFRKNDRGFHPGDELHLRAYDPDTKEYLGPYQNVKITGMTRVGGFLGEDYYVMNIKPQDTFTIEVKEHEFDDICMSLGLAIEQSSKEETREGQRLIGLLRKLQNIKDGNSQKFAMLYKGKDDMGRDFYRTSTNYVCDINYNRFRTTGNPESLYITTGHGDFPTEGEPDRPLNKDVSLSDVRWERIYI